MNLEAYKKLKPGDTVVANRNYQGQFTKGKEYVVSYLVEPAQHVMIEEDDRDSPNGWYYDFFDKKKHSPSRAKQSYKGNGKHMWEPVADSIKRIRVPGGWLYSNYTTHAFGAMVFVPMPGVVNHAI